MNISKAFNTLPVASRKQVSNDIIEGLIAYYLEADWRIYFKRKAAKSIGAKKSIFTFLASLDAAALDRFSYIITEE